MLCTGPALLQGPAASGAGQALQSGGSPPTGLHPTQASQQRSKNTKPDPKLCTAAVGVGRRCAIHSSSTGEGAVPGQGQKGPELCSSVPHGPRPGGEGEPAADPSPHPAPSPRCRQGCWGVWIRRAGPWMMGLREPPGGPPGGAQQQGCGPLREDQSEAPGKPRKRGHSSLGADRNSNGIKWRAPPGTGIS